MLIVKPPEAVSVIEVIAAVLRHKPTYAIVKPELLPRAIAVLYVVEFE